ncbi:hypothetical protein H257_19364 [Aphanomyces astaci]|nr:hypothetical protein H257_19364 [Aphanomyces astaci]ETV63705.1 hypothetical protein H257_19364 [Aphanomyces astaci]|eukprot:XP_009846812.1 hypothetical protein H257_19364 [Aphanomyces astaci]
MVKISERVHLLRNATAQLERRLFMRLCRELLDNEDSDEDELDQQCLQLLHAIERQRYSVVRRNDPFKRTRFHHFLFEIKDTRFRKLFRMERRSFHSILALIDKQPTFRSIHGKVTKAPVAHHLLVFLYYLGANGNAVSNEHLASFFGIGAGTVSLFIRRVTDAVVLLRDQFIGWPNRDESLAIAGEIQSMCGFSNCVGFIDGTLFPFEFKPTLHGEDYYSRKGCYAVAAQIVCDHRAIIRDIYTGWPGSTHDNRLWRNSKLFIHARQYFDRSQFLLGDSAYQLSSCLVPAFKNQTHQVMEHHKSWFNSHIAKGRIKAEHCIGMLKGRFQYLKRIRKVMDGKPAMASIIKTILAASILHNILVTEDDIVPAAWIELQVNCNCNADLRGCRVCFPPNTIEPTDDIESADKRSIVLNQLLIETGYPF